MAIRFSGKVKTNNKTTTRALSQDPETTLANEVVKVMVGNPFAKYDQHLSELYQRHGTRLAELMRASNLIKNNQIGPGA